LLTECFALVDSGWTLVLDFDVADVAPGLQASLHQSLIPFLEQNAEIVENLRRRQSPKEKVFTDATRWLTEHSAVSTSPKTLLDWRGLAEVSFWVGHCYIGSPTLSSFTETDLDEALAHLPLQYLGDVLLGLSVAWRDRFLAWLNEKQRQILTRFQIETQTVAIQDDGEVIRAHFIVNLERSENSSTGSYDTLARDGDPLHNEALRRITLLRKLVPQRRAYGCQGYGHQLGTLKLPFDPTTRTEIPVESFPPAWAVSVNAFFRNLVTRRFRLESWQE
jgi:hypothetical protein